MNILEPHSSPVAFTVDPLANVSDYALLHPLKVRAMSCLPRLLCYQSVCLGGKTAPKSPTFPTLAQVKASQSRHNIAPDVPPNVLVMLF